MMKEVDIVIIKLDKVLVHDMRDQDYVQYQQTEPTARVENNPMLHITPYDLAIDIENLRVREFRRVRNGQETRKLIAIHPKVYEELYSLSDNELSEEVLSNHRNKLQVQLNRYNYQIGHLNKLIDKRDSKIKSLESATFLTRLKWLLSGLPKTES